jgi:hypothetical protein
MAMACIEQDPVHAHMHDAPTGIRLLPATPNVETSVLSSSTYGKIKISATRSKFRVPFQCEGFPQKLKLAKNSKAAWQALRERSVEEK